MAKGIRVDALARELKVPAKAVLMECRQRGRSEVVHHLSELPHGLANEVRSWFTVPTQVASARGNDDGQDKLQGVVSGKHVSASLPVKARTQQVGDLPAAGVLPPPTRRDGQTAQNDLFQFRADGEAGALAGRDGLARNLLFVDFGERTAVENILAAGQQVITERAYRIKIAARIAVAGTGERLRRHEPRRAFDINMAGERTVFALAAAVFTHEAEVQHLDAIRHATPVAEENISRFDVPVNQPQIMRLGQRIADLHEDMNDPAFRQMTATRRQVMEIEAAQIFHGIIENAVGRVAVIIDLNRVRMRELAGQADFALEACNGGRIGAVG